MLSQRRDHPLPFDDVVAVGFFDVDVFPRHAGENGGNRVPVVGRADGNRVASRVESSISLRKSRSVRGLVFWRLATSSTACGRRRLSRSAMVTTSAWGLAEKSWLSASALPPAPMTPTRTRSLAQALADRSAHSVALTAAAPMADCFRNVLRCMVFSPIRPSSELRRV
jgi:hypothetical protein